MKFHQCYTPNRLTEILQQKQCKMQLCRVEGDDVYLVHQPVLCRDFLGDIYWANTHQEPYKIYGMSYDPSKNNSHIDVNKMDLLITFPNKDDFNNFLQNFPLLQKYEEEQNIPASVYEVVESTTSILVHGNEFWTKHIFRISYYTFLLRCLSYAVDKSKCLNEFLDGMLSKYSTNETTYLKTNNFKRFYSKFSSYQSNSLTPHDDIDSIHNHSGFVSVLKGVGQYGFSV